MSLSEPLKACGGQKVDGVRGTRREASDALVAAWGGNRVTNLFQDPGTMVEDARVFHGPRDGKFTVDLGRMDLVGRLIDRLGHLV